MTKVGLFSAALAASLSLAVGVALADADPPGRVGRISYMEGTVSFRTADQSQWYSATLNYPVVAGESFWTDPRSRLELEVGSAVIRLDEQTALDIVALDDNSTQLFLGQGAVNLHFAALPPGGVQVLTPRSAVTLLEPGTYHIDAESPADNGAPPGLAATTLEGRAQLAGLRSPIDILAGESAEVFGDPLQVTLSEGDPTSFDDWALQRDHREMAWQAERYVSPEETGYADLDDNGRWSSDPTYGTVWYPTAVASDWAPYRYGHWAWVPPWGWTWIDDAPWGFAPFHYGRWIEIDGRWAWCPGERVAQPIYAPALVAFIGGADFGIAIAAGSALPAVGWVPLAPQEVYHPDYPASVTYIRNVNITNVNRTEINNITVNSVTNVTSVASVNTTSVAHFHNERAATVVPAAAFAGAAPVQKAVVAVPHEALAHAHVAPSLGHIKPSPAARAGLVVPAVAPALVPHPNAPATLARPRPATAAPPPPGVVPHSAAPGPAAMYDRDLHAPPAARVAAPQHDRAQPQHGGEPDWRGTGISPPVSAPSARSVPTPAWRQEPQHPAAAVAAPAPRTAASSGYRIPPTSPAGEHPTQQTRLMPSPQGWVRAPQPATPAAAHAPAPPHHLPPAKDNDKKDEHRQGG